MITPSCLLGRITVTLYNFRLAVEKRIEIDFLTSIITSVCLITSVVIIIMSVFIIIIIIIPYYAIRISSSQVVKCSCVNCYCHDTLEIFLPKVAFDG